MTPDEGAADGIGSSSNRDALTDWPRWTDRLLSASSAAAREGGRRTSGYRPTSTRERPLVSYVTAVRNNAATLRRAIASVQQQTYTPVEHVILDGASTDGTLEVIEQNADRLDYYASAPDAGVYDALNKAIPLARGDLICVLNSDDWLEPTAAEIAVSGVKELKRSTLLLTAATARRLDHREVEPVVVQKWEPALVHPGCYFTCADDCHNGIYATRSAYEDSGPYDASYRIAGDFKWIMACFEANLDFAYTTDVTVNYVLGGLSGDAQHHGLECVRSMRERFPSLSYEEAGGLHHCFFRLPTFSAVPGRPGDRFDFLRGVLTAHRDDRDLMRAIAWALLTDPRPPLEPEGSGDRVLELVKRALPAHSRLGRAARRVYAATRRT